jgi:hypothetical protein
MCSPSVLLLELIEDFKSEEGAEALIASQSSILHSESALNLTASMRQGATSNTTGSASPSVGHPSVHGILYAARGLLHKVAMHMSA